MFDLIKKYMHWLHGQWPSGNVEKLPLVDADGKTNVEGVYVVGDLRGTPLLKFAADSGANAVTHISQDNQFSQRKISKDVYDIVIVGGGVSGYAAAMEAKKKSLKFLLLESSESFSTVRNFPKEKPIFFYPENMKPEGEIQFSDENNVKEKLLSGLLSTAEESEVEPTLATVSHIEKNGHLLNVMTTGEGKVLAHRVIIAIGRSGNYRQLNVAGEDQKKVCNRLHDPKAYAGKNVLVVGGGDSALEAAIAIAPHCQSITLSYRKPEFFRAKQENIEKLKVLADNNQVQLAMSSQVSMINPHDVRLTVADNSSLILQNDAVLCLLGREAPLEFFRRSKIDIRGESKLTNWIFFLCFFIFTIALYDWKNYGFLGELWGKTNFPEQIPSMISGWGDWWKSQVDDRSTIIGTLAISMKSRSFYYTLLYTACIGIFGWQRIKRRQTRYVTVQTACLFFIQFIPLFLLPELILPWLGYAGFFDAGMSKSIADNLFPAYISADALLAHEWPEWGHPRAYWHAYGFILAWPLNVYNVFTPTPMTAWLVISFVQTFILIPALIYKYGKGAYCGWICSCGALAETMGDKQRDKMPHGKLWNRLNMIGQVILFIAFSLLIIRIGGWIFDTTWMSQSFDLLLKGENKSYQLVNPLSWKWTVDVLLGGILGVGLYFKYSGRIWCRFACPLAALMNIFTRFSRFRIFSDKRKCISCNICTSVCHQGIDVMNFANQGKPMEDPQCVRCSACVQSCPTGVLEFGEIDLKSNQPIKRDRLSARSINIVEIK